MLTKQPTQKRNVTGIILLDKPINMTSNAALQKVKRLYNAKKAGHTGSLDPLASGMLPICLGHATKFSQYLLDTDKTYQVTCKLGATTTTGDAEGEILTKQQLPRLTKKQLEKTLLQFHGKIEQIPSMYSAIKHQGEPLYKLARKGITVERKARAVEIYSIILLGFTKDSLDLTVHCSKGTYIRTLVEDIGKNLNCGAYVTALRRLSVGKYQQEHMLTMGKLEILAAANKVVELDSLLLPVESIFAKWPELILTDTTTYYITQGQAVIVPRAPSQGMVILKTRTGIFLGIGEITNDGKVAPRRMIGTTN